MVSEQRPKATEGNETRRINRRAFQAKGTADATAGMQECRDRAGSRAKNVAMRGHMGKAGNGAGSRSYEASKAVVMALSG